VDNKTLTVVAWDTGDWMAVYIDGMLVDEGHRVDALDLVYIINERLPIGKLEAKRLVNCDKYAQAEKYITNYYDGELV